MDDSAAGAAPDGGTRYSEALLQTLALAHGPGFMSPGGPEAVARIVAGLDLSGKTVLDIGCGLGGADQVLAEACGCRVIGLDVEPVLIERGRARIAEAGLDGRVDLRLVAPGPLPLADAEVDVVFSKESWLFIEDKPAHMAEVFRVLRPGGALAASDWMAGEGPSGPNLLHLFEVRGAPYLLETPEGYRAILAGGGFTGVRITDSTVAAAAAQKDIYERLSGPLAARMTGLLGEADYARWVELSRAIALVLDNREMLSGTLRAGRPR
jgi:phosphoethanolamine N-methyltransferase